MKGFVLAFLLTGAHGLGTHFPYTNLGQALHNAQTVDAWITGVCASGSNQSPIDIVTRKTKYAKTDPGVPTLTGLAALDTMTLRGGADYVAGTPPTEITMNSYDFKSTPILSGGPLDAWSSYAFHFAEFHWGDTDAEGSEHSIDGDFAPLSMALVFTKRKHTLTWVDPNSGSDSFTEAVAAATAAKDESGVAAISYQFVADTTDNADIEDIIVAWETLVETTLLSTTEDTLVTVNISKLINPDDKDLLKDYYYYDGSLTLPYDEAASTDTTAGCAEIVRWIIPTEKIKIGNAQLARIRAMNSPGGTVLRNGVGGLHTNNARNVQTNGNDVFYRKNSKKDDSMAKVLASSLLSIGTFGVIQGFLNQPDTAKALIDNPVVHALQDLEQSIFNREPAVAARQANHHHHPEIQY